MGFDSSDGWEDGERTGFGFVEMATIFEIQGEFSFWNKTFYRNIHQNKTFVWHQGELWGPPHKVRKSNTAAWPVWAVNSLPVFSCLIISGCNFQTIWATAQNVWSGYKESAEFRSLPNIMGFAHWTCSIFLIRQLRDVCDSGMWKCENLFSMRQLITPSEGVLDLSTIRLIWTDRSDICEWCEVVNTDVAPIWT